MLVNGKWTQKWNPFQKTGKNGEFIRQTSSFRHWVTADGQAGKTGSAGFVAEPNRYHLYIALICPWASRTLMTLRLKGLEDIISVSIVDPVLDDNGWAFSSSKHNSSDALDSSTHNSTYNSTYNSAYKSTEDHIHGYTFLHQLYSHAEPNISGRATVPVLWDKQRDTIVNNESADIIEMLNNAFNPWAKHKIDLRPTSLIHEMTKQHTFIYNSINNGVYRAGFAQNQAAYEEAVTSLFHALDTIENTLQSQPYLWGEQLTESDVRLFVTLIRFDIAYHGLFKCNIKRIADYPSLSRYMRELYANPDIAPTVNIDHIKRGYYSIKALNPTGIVPLGPALNLSKA